MTAWQWIGLALAVIILSAFLPTLLTIHQLWATTPQIFHA